MSNETEQQQELPAHLQRPYIPLSRLRDIYQSCKEYFYHSPDLFGDAFRSDVQYEIHRRIIADMANDRAALHERVRQLEAENEQLRKKGCYPMRPPQTGVLNTLIETANALGEDEAWAHLQDESESDDD